MAPLLGRVKRTWLVAGAAALLAFAAFVAWRYISPRESTDDAQIAGHVRPVAARVGGTVAKVAVEDNQQVTTGDVLIEIDPRDYQLAVSRAEAELAAAEAAVIAAQANVPVTSTTTASEQTSAEAGTVNAQAAVNAAEREVEAAEAKVAAARARLAEVTANATRAQQDYERLQPLAEKQEISRQQLDAARAAAEAGRAAVDSAKAAIHEAEANLAVAQSRRQQAEGGLTQAQAQARAASTAPQQVKLTKAQASAAEARLALAKAALEQARVDLERTTVRAPADGVVSRRSVEVGQVIQPGQLLLAVTSLDDIWVVANFKETQLSNMRPGQPAEIDVDAYGRAFSAHVDSIAAATGATFSLLPPDNASGNFVKIVQRVPVKIVLDEPASERTTLRPGMSVNATVYLK